MEEGDGGFKLIVGLCEGAQQVEQHLNVQLWGGGNTKEEVG